MMAWGTRLLSATILIAGATCLYTAASASCLNMRVARTCVAIACAAAALWVQRSSARLLERGRGPDGEGESIEGGAGVAGDVRGSPGLDVGKTAGDERGEGAWSKEAFAYYMQLWKLFYGAYFLLPFAL
jgi:hypothetical protein